MIGHASLQTVMFVSDLGLDDACAAIENCSTQVQRDSRVHLAKGWIRDSFLSTNPSHAGSLPGFVFFLGHF